MRLSFAFVGILAASMVSAVAHADTVDDFVLTGNSHTETWSLPSPDPYPIVPYMAMIFFQTTVTTDGVPSTQDVDFYESGGLGVGTIFFGPPLYSLAGGAPGYVDVTFRAGTYDLSSYVLGSTGFAYAPFTLTITPEATTAAAPEPSTLALAATGLLGLVPVLRRRFTDAAA